MPTVKCQNGPGLSTVIATGDADAAGSETISMTIEDDRTGQSFITTFFVGRSEMGLSLRLTVADPKAQNGPGLSADVNEILAQNGPGLSIAIASAQPGLHRDRLREAQTV